MDCPGEQDLGRGLVDSPGNGGDDRIFQQVGLAAMPQCREGLQYDAILLAKVQKVPFWEVRMGFDVNHRGLDPRGSNDFSRLFQADVGQSDGLALAFVHEALHRLQVSSNVTVWS